MADKLPHPVVQPTLDNVLVAWTVRQPVLLQLLRNHMKVDLDISIWYVVRK